MACAEMHISLTLFNGFADVKLSHGPVIWVAGLLEFIANRFFKNKNIQALRELRRMKGFLLVIS
jgi:hypothetical protein